MCYIYWSMHRNAGKVYELGLYGLTSLQVAEKTRGIDNAFTHDLFDRNYDQYRDLLIALLWTTRITP